jgi:hypothetical protein
MKRAASSVSYWVTTAERDWRSETPPGHRATAASRGDSSTTTPGASPAHRAQLRGEKIADLPGFSCHSLASCAATAGAVIRIPGAIAAKITIAASKRRDTTSPAAGKAHYQQQVYSTS